MSSYSPQVWRLIPGKRGGTIAQIARRRRQGYHTGWHQPLHCTSRFDHDQPNGDRGGNLVALCARPCRSELHALWDDILGTRPDPESAIRKAAKLDAPDPHLAAVKDEDVWIAESLQAAKTSVYVAPIGVGAGPFEVDAEYRRQARAVAAERVAFRPTRVSANASSAFGFVDSCRSLLLSGSPRSKPHAQERLDSRYFRPLGDGHERR